ncbi:neprosin family prolyl endopeptidase [Corallococcus aberystwythensis]|nr:neprosin family prolyl endopeptidase [Corallococcus aberystwythensis]
MSRAGLILSMFVVGCGGPEPLGEVASEVRPQAVAGTSEVELALAPSEFHCEVMTEAARAAVPPPPPAIERAASAPRLRAVCPPGQVPIYHQAELRTHKAGPPLSPGLNGATGSRLLAGAYWYAGVLKPTDALSQSGVGASILFSNPAVYDQSDMVTSQMSIVRGANYHLVEMGLRKFWDAFPRLMISQWSYGTFNDAAGFVQVHGVYGPGMPLTSYYGYAVQQYIRHDNGNWWIWFNDAWVGYFPGSLWSGQFTSGDMAHFYGEVYSAQNRVPPLTDMGTGQFSGTWGSAYIHGMCLHTAGASCNYITNGWRSETNAAYYSLSYWNGADMEFGGNGGG